MVDYYDNYEEDEAKEGFGDNNTNSYREIVLRSISKCATEMQKEMTKGKTIFIEKNGANIPIIIPDQRKVVIGCINVFYDLMLRVFDDEATKNLNELEEEINGLNEKYLEKYLSIETNIPLKKQAEKTRTLNTETALGNMLLQEKEEEKLSLYRKMFQQLLLLFKRKNDLNSEISLGLDGN